MFKMKKKTSASTAPVYMTDYSPFFTAEFFSEVWTLHARFSGMNTGFLL